MASIEKRGDNSYRITVCDGYDSQGTKIKKRKSVTLVPGLTTKQTEKELQRQAALFEDEVSKGTYIDAGKITFGEFIERWLVDYGEKQLMPKTLYRYKEMIKFRIIPALGHIQLSKLQPTHLLEFYNNLEEKGIRLDTKYIATNLFMDIISKKQLKTKDLANLFEINEKTVQRILKGKTTTLKIATRISNKLDLKLNTLFIPAGTPQKLSDTTILHHHRLISIILNCAVYWQLLLINPANRVKSPKVEKKDVSFYDEDQTENMLSLLENEPLKYKTMINIAVYGGMRLGELAALEWSDINFDNCLLRIERAEQYIPNIGVFDKDPKNYSSKRVITIPESLIELLKEYKVWQNELRLKCGDQWQDHNRLFTQWNGKPIFPDTPSKWFKKFREKNNLPEITFHQIRHTNASLLISQGVDVSTVSSRLGHARTSTTTDIYSHALKRADKTAAEKLEELFGKKKTNDKKSG